MRTLTFSPKCKGGLISAILIAPTFAHAQIAKVPVSEGSPLKVVFGLLVVLATIAALAWAMKKLSNTKMGAQSLVRIVGGVSVGSRERVVVVEVAGRWIVVGVAPGRVNGIANLAISESAPHEQSDVASEPQEPSYGLKNNLSQYDYTESNESPALANPALTSLFKKLLKK